MSGRREKAKKRRIGCFLPFIAVIAVLFWAPTEFYLSNNVPRLENATVRSSRLPEDFDGFRILHLSDLHEKSFGTDNETLMRLAREAKPDIIAITGDLIQSLDGLDYAEALLPALREIAPVYYVTGNHEWAERTNRLVPRLKDIIEKCGAVYLDSSWQTLERDGEAIVLAGLCDPNGPRNEPGPIEFMQYNGSDFPDGAFTLLLSHRYDRAGEYADAGYDVVLAGHAHGGVVRLPFTDGLIGPDREWFPKGTSGVTMYGGTAVVVSRGVGDTYFPRFLNRPQMLLVTLRKGT